MNDVGVSILTVAIHILFLLSTADCFVHSGSKLLPSSTCGHPSFTSQFIKRPIHAAKNTEEDADDPSQSNDADEEGDDVGRRSSVSRDRAISALSRPKFLIDRTAKDASGATTPPASSSSDDPSRQKMSTKGSQPHKRQSNQKPTADKSRSNGNKDNSKPDNSNRIAAPTNPAYSSLLPPLKPNDEQPSGSANSIDSGLSSWEDFLGSVSSVNAAAETARRNDPQPKSPASRRNRDGTTKFRPKPKNPSPASTSSYNKSHPGGDGEKLPSITDLFPSDLSSTLKGIVANAPNQKGGSGSYPPTKLPTSSLDDVLPVSELFYRSAQNAEDEEGELEEAADDEELPFSAEQSDTLTTEHNKVKIRRNRVDRISKPSKADNIVGSSKEGSGCKPKQEARNKNDGGGSRRMVRRGMEMLVGGVPINADPPQRFLDLYYKPMDAKKPNKKVQWYETISTDSCDFGPMLYVNGQSSLSKSEIGLFCEYFVEATMKWNICPNDLKAEVNTYLDTLGSDPSEAVMRELEEEFFLENIVDEVIAEVNNGDSPAIASISPEQLKDLEPKSDLKQDDELGVLFPQMDSSNAFEISSLMRQEFSSESGQDDGSQDHLGGELVFSMGVQRCELVQEDDGADGSILKDIVTRAIVKASNLKDYSVNFTSFDLQEMDDGSTKVAGNFTLQAKKDMSPFEAERKVQRINRALAQAMDDGDMQLEMAASARQEDRWSSAFRERVVEEFLFEDDDPEGEEGPRDSSNAEGDASIEEEVDYQALLLSSLKDAAAKASSETGTYESLFDLPGNPSSNSDDLYKGGGNAGVFWDFSEANKENAPYQGNLGLRLVDAVTERAKQRQPRVIAIGDVHGCIDELQDLLRQCDYRPGDLVVFLGDLVSKGPDSLSVVQMAREIGALGIRGNHDFEVIRWHQAIKSGVDPPAMASEHFHIASCLSNEDMKWMYSLPWYISSKDLGALFVHAGFVSGIRLAKQNPRLMMNMRSILPDGTVTSKFFNNWPWARLWDGPQTVLFGHDADRGLQQYEHAIGLDTGCVYGGRLTACILPEKRLVSVSARREYFKYRRKHYD